MDKITKKSEIGCGIFLKTAAAVICFLLLVHGAAFAEDRTEIDDISLTIDSEIEVGGYSSEVDVDTDDEDYYVADVKVTNAMAQWSGGVVPRVEITLMVEDEDSYCFASGGEDLFSFSGEDVEYVSLKREKKNTVLVLTVELEKLEEEDLSISGLRWDEESGCAIWDGSGDAQGYQICLYKDGEKVREETVRYGGECSYDFSGSISEGGSYRFEVRAVGSGSSYGKWVRSAAWKVGLDEVSSIRSGSSSDSYTTVSSDSSYGKNGYDADDDDDDDDDDDEGSVSSSDAGGGKESAATAGENGGPGVSSASSSKSSSSASGTSSFPDASSASSGSSASTTVSTQNGSSSSVTVSSQDTDSASAAVSSQSGGSALPRKALDSPNSSGWQQDDIGRWYQNADGSFPAGGWALIDGSWYYFDASGYISYGWIEDSGKWYYCGEDGAMLVNARTPDGHFVGGDGMWIQ